MSFMDDHKTRSRNQITKANKVAVEACWGGHDNYYWRLTFEDKSGRIIRESVPDSGKGWAHDRPAATRLLQEVYGFTKRPTYDEV